MRTVACSIDLAVLIRQLVGCFSWFVDRWLLHLAFHLGEVFCNQIFVVGVQTVHLRFRFMQAIVLLRQV